MLTYLMPFSLPPFTEEWARTYLQVLFESFLFALGVPAAIYNLIDSDIKHLTQTRARARRYFLVTALLYIVVFAIVWLIPPDPNSQPGMATPLGPSSIIKSLVALATVTVLPFGVLVMGLWLNQQFEREKVIARLGNMLVANFKASGHLESMALKDLSYLGEHGRAGNEKRLVLDVLDRLARSVREQMADENTAYQGFELEGLIRHIPAMLDNSVEPGNEENYRRALDVLSNIWRCLGTRRITDDSFSTRETIRHLALRAVEKTSEATVLAYLEIAADCDNQMVFDMGIAAFGVNKFLVATAALNKLEEMAANALTGNSMPEAQRDTRANLLGMTAHFAAGGPSGLRRAETVLRFSDEFFAGTLREALADAIDYQYAIGRFETSDILQLFATKAATMKMVDLDRRIPEKRYQLPSKAGHPLTGPAMRLSSETEQLINPPVRRQESRRKHAGIDDELINPKRFRISEIMYALYLLFFSVIGFLVFRIIETEEIVAALGIVVMAIFGMWIMVILTRVKSILRVLKRSQSSSSVTHLTGR